jgi:calmodulin-lysine N-methyltransferase
MNIESQVSLLRWSVDDELGDVARIKESLVRGLSHDTFDVITAADCLFFRDYHDDLLWVLNNTINKLNNNSVIYLLQPRRDNTMDIFLSKAAQYYDIHIFEDYNVDVSKLRHEYQGAAAYDEDIHYPVLVVMKWKRG